jgi:hypothetical protein
VVVKLLSTRAQLGMNAAHKTVSQLCGFNIWHGLFG